MTSAAVVSRMEARHRADEIRAFRAELERLADDGPLFSTASGSARSMNVNAGFWPD